MKKITAALLIAITTMGMISCNSGKSGDSYVLKMRLNKGDKFGQDMKMDMDMNITAMGMTKDMKMGMNIGADFEVLDSTAAGKDLKITYTKSEMKMNMGGDPSTSAITDSIMNESGKMLVGKSVVFTVADNKITDVKGMDQMVSADSLNPATRQAMSKMFSKDNLNSMFGMMFSIYPNKPVKEGDTWTADNTVDMNGMKMNIKANYKLIKVTNGIAEIAVDGTVDSKGSMEQSGMNIDMDMKGTQKGTMNLKVADGYLKDGKYTMDIDATMNMMGQKMPMKMKAAYTMTGK